jgi:hypothetical protein
MSRLPRPISTFLIPLPSAKVSISMFRILIRDCIRRIRRFFVSQTDTKHEYETFLVRCTRHKEWPEHLIELFFAKKRTACSSIDELNIHAGAKRPSYLISFSTSISMKHEMKKKSVQIFIKLILRFKKIFEKAISTSTVRMTKEPRKQNYCYPILSHPILSYGKLSNGKLSYPMRDLEPVCQSPGLRLHNPKFESKPHCGVINIK